MLMNFIVDKIVPFMMVVCILMIPYIFYVVYEESQKPGFELKKDEWHCTQNTITMIYTGKVMVPVTECIQWTRN